LQSNALELQVRGLELGLRGSFLEVMQDEGKSAYVLYIGVIVMIL